MSVIEALLLGTVQGLTEFLPISSSGHLVLMQNILGFKSPELLFDVSVHMGTLAAVVIFFAKDILRLTKSFFIFLLSIINGKKDIKSSLNHPDTGPDLKLIIFIIIGSIPTAFIGLLLSKIAHNIFSSPILVGFMLIITGAVLWITKNIRKNRNLPLSKKKAFLIGLVQGIAIIPGISRSGTTISIALLYGIDKGLAAKYSFLLSIPAVLGAQILGIKNFAASSDLSINIILIGAVAACITGYAALVFLIKLIRKGRLYYFAPYCWIIGVLTIFFTLT